MRIKTIHTSNENFVLKYFRCRDGKRTETIKNWDGGYLFYPFLHSTTVSHYVLHVHSVQWNAGMGNTDTLLPILVSVLFPSLHLKYFRIKFLLLVIIISWSDLGKSNSDINPSLCSVLLSYT